MGTVWLGTDLLLRRAVAVKQLTPGIHGRDRDHLRDRAFQEARALAAVEHSAVVEIFDVIQPDGDPWLVMKYIDGRSITDIVAASGALPVSAVARIGAAVADALGAVHAAGILHRDVKPANILLTPRDKVFLVDFGIAAMSGARSRLTNPHSVVGTVGFMAPERLRAGDVGPPSDTWSLGVTLYYALTGQLPFDAPNTEATMLRVFQDDPAPLDGPLSTLVMAMLAKDPASRPSLSRAASAFRRAASFKPPPTRTREPERVSGPVRASSGIRVSDAELAAAVVGRAVGDAARALLEAPREQAVRVLDAQGSATLVRLLPELAQRDGGAQLIGALDAGRLGRAIGRMDRADATTLTGMLPPVVAARALGGTDPRTAKGPLSDLDPSDAERIIRTMSVTIATQTLQYVHPVRIAALLRLMPERRADALLRRLSGPVRLQVQRELQRDDPPPKDFEGR